MKKTIAFTLAGSLLAMPTASRANSYVDGLSAWAEFKSAEASVDKNTPFGEGWLYWIGNRSRPDHGDCSGISMLLGGNSVQGCYAAMALMAPIDRRRMEDPQFRRGFNDGAASLAAYDPDSSGTVSSRPAVDSGGSVSRVREEEPAPVEVAALCGSSEKTAERVLRRESRVSAAEGDLSLEYRGGRYVGRNVYKCVFQATISAPGSSSGMSVSLSTTWKVEWMPAGSGPGTIQVTDQTTYANVYR